jgi:AraC-like DNA-binding protein
MSMVAAAIDAGAFREAVVSAGVVKIWEARRACSLAAGVGREQAQAAEAALYARELNEFGEEEANLRAGRRGGDRSASLLFGNGQAPLWRVLSGLMPGMDWDRLHPNERGGRLTVLIRAVEKVVRYEWRAFERAESRRQKAEGGTCNDDPRVRWWDPMRLVCEQFGIAYSMLSRISREVAGLGATDLTDRVKAETVRARMREDVKQWVLELFEEEKKKTENELESLAGEELADAMWSRVAKKRGRGRWSRSAWAVGYGYSSYTRFQRACLAEYGISPVELEREVMEEVLKSKVRSQKSKVEGDTTTGAVLERGGIYDLRMTIDACGGGPRGDDGHAEGKKEGEGDRECPVD